MLPQSIGLLKLVLNVFRVIYIQGREFCSRHYMKHTFSTGLFPDSYEPVCFKLGTMQGTTKLYIENLDDLDLPLKVTEFRYS